MTILRIRQVLIQGSYRAWTKFFKDFQGIFNVNFKGFSRTQNCDFSYLLTHGSIIGKNRSQEVASNKLEIMKLLFVHLRHLRFWRRYKFFLLFWKVSGLSMTLKCSPRSNPEHKFY
jgi:hypothetical protein